MSSTISDYIFLWEYDKPLLLAGMLNEEAGIFSWLMTQPDNTFSDSSQNTIKYNVRSFRYEDIYFSSVDSIADLRLTANSFYYDVNTTILYVRREDWNPLVSFNVYAGIAVGYSLGNLDFAYFNNIYYGQRVKTIFNIKKEKDQFYYGTLKFQSGSVSLLNQDGELDDWASRNLYNQPNRILIGAQGALYTDLESIFTGLIGNTKRTWDDNVIDVEDVRKGMTTSIANNLLNKIDWPYLNDDSVDIPKPIAYGQNFNAKCICLNSEEGGSYYTFLICDTKYNAVASLDVVYVDKIAVSVYSTNLTAGTFVLTSGIAGTNLEVVTADFTMGILNGVDIIKDLVKNYDNRPYLSDFWDVVEVDVAQALARNTSVYVNDDKKLQEIIKDVASDIFGLFFPHDDGKYTILIFDENRTPVKIIYKDEWMDDPKMEDNANEFLTSCIVEYHHDLDEDKYRQYENTGYKDDAFDTYKKYNKEPFTTNLTTLADAMAFSEDVLKYRTAVPITVSRTLKFVNYNYRLEIGDFVICDPLTREYNPITKIKQVPVMAIWEIIGIVKDIKKMGIALTLRYIKSYVNPAITYAIRGLSDGDSRVMSDGELRIIGEQ